MLFDFHRCSLKKLESRYIPSPDVYEALKRGYPDNQALFDGYGYSARAINRLVDNFTLKLRQNIFGIYLINVHISGNDYEFILDTGASISGLLAKHVEAFKLEKIGSLPIASAGGTINDTGVFCIPRMFIGGLELLNQPVAQLNDADFNFGPINKQIMHFDGIIGWDILKNFDFSIDNANMLFKCLKQTNTGLPQNLIGSSIPVMIVKDENNKDVVFGLDSGAHISWLNENFVTKAALQVTGNKPSFQLGVMGMEMVNIKIIRRCHYKLFDKEIVLKNTRTGVTMISQNCYLDGIMGNEIFEDHEVVFKNSSDHVYIV